MYQLKRSEKIVEQIKVGEDVLEINLDAGAVYAQFAKCHNALIIAEEALKNVTAENMANAGENLEKYGAAVVGLLQVVFGDKNTEKILQFYEGNYIEMFTEIYPFLTTVVVPKMNETSRRKAEQVKAMYRSGKK